MHGSEREGWLLTESGVAFARKNATAVVGEKKRASLKERAWLKTERARLLATDAFRKYRLRKSSAVTLREAEGFFRIDNYVTGEAREAKMLRILNAFADDEERSCPRLEDSLHLLEGVKAVNEPTIFVRSHVSRDLLQNAALFKTDKLVVWEYVSNGLQYVRSWNQSHRCRNARQQESPTPLVADNGRGMGWADLQNFFVMHGENVDRKGGRPGRGRFGTGEIRRLRDCQYPSESSSVRNGKRSVVELTRDDLEAASSGSPIPVRTVEKEVSSNLPDGTNVEFREDLPAVFGSGWNNSVH